MPLHIFSHAPYFNTSFKNQLFKDLAERLRETWTDEDKFLALVGNVYIHHKPYDAVLITNNTVCIIDFQDYGGRIEPRKTGNWRAGKNVMVGNNPYISLDNNIKLLGQSLYQVRAINSIQGLVLFKKPIVYIQQTSPITDSWFHISDIQGIATDSNFIYCGLEKFTEDEIKKILVHLGVKREEVDDLIIATKAVEPESHLINDISIPPTPVNFSTPLVDDSIAKEALDNYTLGLMYIDFNFIKAIECFTKAIEIHSHYPAAYCARAYSLIKADRLDEALDDCSVAFEQDCENGLAVFFMGQILYKQEEYGDAIDYFYNASTYIEKTTTDDTFHYEWQNLVLLTGLCKQKIGSHKSAIDDLTEVINFQSLSNTLLYSALEHRAISHISEEKYVEAIKDLDRIIENCKDYQTPVYFNRGICYKNLGDYEAAINDFSQHISSNPEDVNGYCEKAFCKEIILKRHLEKNQPKHEEYCNNLIAEYSRIIELTPSKGYYLLNRAEIYLRLNQQQNALSDFDKLILLQPSRTKLYIKRAKIHEKLGNFSDAVNDLDIVLTRKPSEIEFYILRAELKVKLGKHKDAIKDYDKAIEYSPESAEYYIKRAEAKSSNWFRDLQGAINDYDKAIALTSDNWLLYIERAKVKAISGDISGMMEELNSNLVEQYYFRVRVELRAKYGDYLGAMEEYNTLIELSPNKIPRYLDLARFRMDISDYNGALEIIDWVINHEPSIFNYKLRAELRNKLGDHNGANEDYQLITLLADQSLGGLHIRAYAKFQLLDYEGAIEDCNEILELYPNNSYNSSVYRLRCLVKSKNGDYTGAIRDCDEANTLGYFNFEGYYHTVKAEIESEYGNYDEALKYYDLAIGNEDIFNGEYIFDKILLMINHDDFIGAIKECDRALKADPTIKYTYKQKAKAQLGIPDVSGAILNYSKAIELMPYDPEFYFLRAQTKELQGDNKGALNDYSMAIEIDPYEAEYYLKRGKLFNKISRYPEKRADYIKVLELKPYYTFEIGNIK
ncbi:tetratricopeptide repeat protein [uncultured Pontibacter sp.]|uniref:tetratricopeptide repeat protein n=1 Tax=uncultured Pontibacter sp. TaxID=453356 RepID=UPI002610D247|nr:tetratricopeptide repeat protein [uncultured Pontibacter sp.]